MPPYCSAFARRHNPDGTTDSICTRCFVTVASSRSEPDLEGEENRHVCNHQVLEYWRQLDTEGKRKQVTRSKSHTLPYAFGT